MDDRVVMRVRTSSGGAIASLAGLGVLLIFIIQNTDRVRFQFLFWSFTWPLWLLTVASALLGALVWFGLGVLRRHRRRWNAAQPGSNRWLVGEVYRRRMAHERSLVIMAIADGGVIEVGSHGQLMSAKGFYHERC